MTSPRSGPLYESGNIIGDKYEVEAFIGSGGMGVVVLARHVVMNHRVAIKIMTLPANANATDAVARFLREARAAARIESEHVVRVTDVAALLDGTPYIVMEYLEGEDLSQVLAERRQLSIEEATDYVLQACEGLAHAHAAGVIHRDLKPSNLFRARRPHGATIVKVLDFGTSKLASRAGEAAVVTTNALVGTPLYMAPEQIRSAANIDSRADVWSLGLVLYELLTGELPFSGATIPEICLAITGGEPKPITFARPDVPPELQAILRTCMAKDRSERYPTVAALAHCLAPFAPRSARVHADRASAVLKASPPAAEPEADTIAWTRPSRPTWRRRTWLAAGIACVAAAAMLGAIAAREPASGSVVASASPSAATTDAHPRAPTVVKVSVPSDESIRVAGASHAREPAPSTVPPPRASALPASASPARANKWKWGDRK